MKPEYIQLLTALASNPELAKRADSSHRTFAELLCQEFRDLTAFVSESESEPVKIESESRCVLTEGIISIAYIEGRATYTAQVVPVNHLSEFTFVHKVDESFRVSLRNTGLRIYACDELSEAVTISDGASEFISRAYPGSDVRHDFKRTPSRFCAGVIKIARAMTQHLRDAHPNIEFSGVMIASPEEVEPESKPAEDLVMHDLEQIGRMTESDLDDQAERIMKFHNPKTAAQMASVIQSLALNYQACSPNWACESVLSLYSPDRWIGYLADFLKQYIFPLGRRHLLEQIESFIAKWDISYQPSLVWVNSLTDSDMCRLLDHLKWRSEFTRDDDDPEKDFKSNEIPFAPEPEVLRGWLDARFVRHGKLEEIEEIINSLDDDSRIATVLARIEPYFLDSLHLLDFLKSHYHIAKSPRFDARESGVLLSLLRVLCEIIGRSKDLPDVDDLLCYTMQQTEALAESLTKLHGEAAPLKIAEAYGLEGERVDELKKANRPIMDICIVLLQQAKADYQATLLQAADIIIAEAGDSTPITYPTATEIKAHFQSGSLNTMINSWLSDLKWDDEKIEDFITALLDHYNSTGIFESRRKLLENDLLSVIEFIREVLIFAMAYSN